MRRAARMLMIAALAVTVCIPVAEARWGKKKRASKSEASSAAGFVLQSAIVGQIEEVKLAMVWVEENPASAEAWQHLGTVLAGVGAYEDAIEALSRATVIAPEDPSTWTDLGAAYLRSTQYKDGIKALHTALDLEPFFAKAHYNLGIAYLKLGKQEKALDAFESALTIDPDLGDPRLNPGAVNNPALDLVKLRVYMNSTGAAPAIFTK